MKNFLSTILFLCFIFGFFILHIFSPDQAFSAKENRYLQTAPSFSIERLADGSFLRDFETYVSDQFPLRDDFISLYIIGEVFSGKKEVNGVFLAEDGYLIENLTLTDEAQFQKNINYIQELFESAKEKNIDTKLMIIPNPYYILQDKLPRFATTYDQANLFQELQDAFNEDFISVTDTFFAEKENDIFYKTDHHFTTKGAFFAYSILSEIWEFIPTVPDMIKEFDIKKVSEDFYGTIYTKFPLPFLKADTIEQWVHDEPFSIVHDFNQTTNSLYNQDSLQTNDQYTYFLDGNHAITEITTNTQNNHHLLLIKDSFAHCFVPFLINDFETITILDYRYFKGSTQALLEEKNITHLLGLYHAMNFASDGSIYFATK